MSGVVEATAATMRALDVLAEGPRDAKGFAAAMWPSMDHGRVTRVGSRGGYAAGQQAARVAGAVLARLVRAGLATSAWVGSGSAVRRRWSNTPAGLRARQRLGSPRPAGGAP